MNVEHLQVPVTNGLVSYVCHSVTDIEKGETRGGGVMQSPEIEVIVISRR
jgi:hypothetical protein